MELELIKAGIRSGLGLGLFVEVATIVCAANGWKEMGQNQLGAGVAKVLAAGTAMGVFREIRERFKGVSSEAWPLSKHLSICIPAIATAGLVFAVTRQLFHKLLTLSKQPAPDRASTRTAPSARASLRGGVPGRAHISLPGSA
jgi:hypothetical protein